MKRAAFLSVIMTLIVTLLLPGAVPVGAAAAAAEPTWSSAIVYFNPTDSGSGNSMSVMYFKDSGETILTDPSPLTSYQSGVLLIGNILRDSAFKGSAVISATVPLVALYMQTATGGEPYSPVIYNSFDSNQTSSNGGYFVPDVQLGTSYKVMLGVQNVESEPMILNLRMIPEGNPGGALPDFENLATLQPQQSYIINVSELAGVPANFSGSLYLWGSTDSVSNARMVAALRAVQTGGRRAFGYEGVAAGNPVVFMPAASCKLGANQQTSSYAVQNAHDDNTAAEVRVDYYTPAGELFASYPASGTISVPQYAMVRINTCDPVSDGKDTTGKYLSAVIRSTNGVPIAATGSVTSSDGLATGFTGQSTLPPERLDALRDTNGRYHIALPYVYFASDPGGIRTYISLMNATDTVDGSPTPAEDIKIRYYGRDGSLIQTQTLASAASPLAANAKASTDPMSAGAIDVGAAGFYGAAVVESDQPLAALVRVQRNVNLAGYSTLGDDYNGVFVNP